MNTSTTEQLDSAIVIAVNAHAGVINKDLTPYILHPIRLMQQAETNDEKIVAILHDTVEDTYVTLVDLKDKMFPQHIVDAVDALSKRVGETYEDAIERIALNPLATKIKLLDLYDNIDVTRLPVLGDWELKRTAKYHKAILRLRSV